jgi:PKD repeat protein
LIEDPEGGCRSCTPPTSSYRNETFFRIENSDPDDARITDIFFAPYNKNNNNVQALYVISRGGEEPVIRIRNTGIVDNAPPTPEMILPGESDLFNVGEELQFDGSASSDPDGDDLTFFWEFGDGETSEEISPIHSFTSAGEYTVTLTVKDSMGQEQQTSKTIMIGQPPKVMILSPLDNEEFYVGEVLQLRGLALDSMGGTLSDDHLTWEVRQHHANHFHPYLDPTVGNNIELFGAPAPEDFFAATNSYLHIILSATDSYGLHTEVDLLVQPIKRNVTIASSPPGIELVVENYAVITPTEIVSWQGHHLTVLAKDFPPFEFRAWSDGDTNQERKIEISEDNQQILAFYCARQKWFCTSSEECCSGFCIENSCQSDGSEQNNESQNFDSSSDQTNNGGSSSENQTLSGDLDDAEEDTGEGNQHNTDTTGDDAEGVTGAGEENDQTERSSLGMTGIALIVLVSLILITCPFLFMYIRKEHRLTAGKGDPPSNDTPFGRDSLSIGGDKEEVAIAPTFLMVIASNSGGKSNLTLEDRTSASHSRNINASSDTGSSLSSEAVSPEPSTTGEDIQETISLEETTEIPEMGDKFVDLESSLVRKEVDVKGSNEESRA